MTFTYDEMVMTSLVFASIGFLIGYLACFTGELADKRKKEKR